MIIEDKMRQKHYLVSLQDHSDKRGNLNVAEYQKEIPFLVKRIFFNYNTDTSMHRAEHANTNSCFFMISLSGSCDVIVNDGQSETVYKLDDPCQGLYLDKMVWKKMTNYTSNNILLILTDNLFDAAEYIEDYEEYLCIIKTENDNDVN